MRSEASEVGSQGGRKRFLTGTRREAARRISLRRVALETLELEPRTLLSNLPTPQVAGPPIDISNTGGNQSAPTIAIDPNDPLKMAAAWTRFDTNLQNTQVRVEASYSVDGGNTWSNPFFVGGVLTNPTTTNPTAPFPQVTDAHVAFDRSDNFYILDSQHTADNATGALALNKYNLSGNVLATTFTNRVVYEWVAQDQAYTPMLAVDNNVATFTDVNASGATQNQSDPYSGNVYVAWATNDVAPKNFGGTFNPNRIVVEASSDGGIGFSGYQVINSNGNFGSAHNTNPQLVVSQGAAPRKAGTNGPADLGSPGVGPGQITVAWDDFGSLSTANPPLDAIMASPVTPGISADFQATGGPIVDATNPGGNAPHVPGVTDFTIPVDITNANFGSLSDLAVTVNITHPADNELSLVLIPPPASGLQPITLLNNQTNAAGGGTGGGVGGANFGTTASGVRVGTTFSDNATRFITDGNAGAPFDGFYRPEGGSLQATYGGATAAQLKGNWTLEITDFRAGNVGSLANWSLRFVSGLQAGANTEVTTTTVRGSLTEASGGLGTAITPLGITPQISLAEDNTLGAYSPYQGRIYLAYVDRSTIQNNQADNTDILLTSSDDGGLSWRAPAGFNNTPGFSFNAGQVVNDDNGATDGFSESNPGFSGRPQFEPQVAIDQATGSVVLSWLDTRNDAARVRVADYVTASNDGGQSFSSQVYLNSSQTAIDAITGKTVNLGPIPDNATGSAVGADSKTFGFGRYEGLAVFGGTIHGVWSSDLNGGGDFSDGKAPLNIRTATAAIPAGPRIISSTMGPVGLPGDTVNSDTTADGTPIVSAFQVTFDRPVDPSTFKADQVQVFYHDPTTTNVSGEQVPVNSVVALDNGPFGATRFQINFAPRSGVGTYSYTVGPNISDRIRSTNLVIAPTSGPQAFASSDTPVSSAFGGTITSTIKVSGFAANQVVSNATVNLTVTDPFVPAVTITLIAPDGTLISLASFEGNSGPNYQNFTNTTFADSAAISIQSGSAPFSNAYRPETPLSRLKGHAINGNWQLEVTDYFGDPVQLSNWTLNLTPGVVSALTKSGNTMDQNANGLAGEPAANGVGLGDVYAVPMPTTTGTGFVSKTGQFYPGPYDSNTLPLIIPGPHVVSTTIPGNPAANGTTVVNGPVSSIDVTFDRDMNPATFTLAQVLGIQGPLGAITATSITPNPTGTDPDPSHPRTYRINFPQQVYSGTYTVQLASSITSKNGDALDTNLNAGVDVLRDTPSTNATGPVTYPSTNVGLSLAPGATETSTLQVPDNFTIQGLQVALDITEPNDPDLTATLVGPDGTSITLFSGVGGTGTHADFHQTVFDDAATTPIQNGGPPFTGRFIPQQPLGTFVGKASGGSWKLVLSSSNPQGVTGTLNSWSITFTQNTVTYPSSNASLALPVGKTVKSTLIVPASFTAQNPTLTLDITEPYDPGLTATLTGPDGTTITLFSSKSQVGNSGTKKNFTQTTFDDTATTLITNGSPPFTGRYVPQQPLSSFAGKNAAGVWTLTLTTDATSSDPNAQAGELNSWSLSFQKVAPISGLGEPVADQFSTSFRIFQMDPTNRVASTTWTAVGPVSAGSVLGSSTQSNGYAGRATAIAVDPSDPSGNTVYIGAASGGVWKTTDFLTTDPAGPTWIPLTDFGPTLGINIGSIAVFSRNNDPNQSIIFAGTGESNTNFLPSGGNTNQGVGILRSMDGGRTWELLDSKDNSPNLPFSIPANSPPNTPVRDHVFAANGGTNTYKILVDPRPTPTGDAIVYAALGSGTSTNPLTPNTTGGLWRSTDSGIHWQKMSSAALGDATDVIFDLNSATVDQVSNPTGNVNIIFAAFASNGVYISPNRGQTLNPINGNNFDPLIRDPAFVPPKAITLDNGGQVNLAGARVTLAKPALIPANQPQADVKNLLYEGWLYAAVTNNGHLAGLFLTKDYGQTWTQLKIPTFPSLLDSLAEPSNDPTRPNYDPVGSSTDPNASYHVALTVDPSDPNIVYLGGTSDGQQSGLIRIDATGVYDSHALVGYDNSRPDGGKVQINTAGRATVKRVQDGPPQLENTGFINGNPAQYVNLIQDPQNPFQTNSTIYVFNTNSFTNDGSGIKWIPFDQLLQANATDTVPSTGLHQMLAMTDPLTGKARLIVADDQGIFTGVDNGNGTLNPGIGSLAAPTYARNGDLQIAQLLTGSSQPSTAAAQVAKALYYGNGVDLGETNSDPNILNNGDLNAGSLPISGFGIANSGELDGTQVAADQQGRGIVYQYAWPGFGGSFTNFFQVSVDGGPFISRTSGLIQANVGNIDPQWPIAIPNYPNGVRPGNFAVNPVDGDQVIMSSNAGRIFSTINQGESWQVIGNPGDLDSSYAPALAFGAPDPSAPTGIGNLNDFLYAGTINGNIFVTQTGGGAAGNAWTKISTGLDGSPVMEIVTNPTRGSHEAYAVTQGGVYHIADSVALANAIQANAPAATLASLGWQPITSNLFNLTIAPFGNQTEASTRLAYLTSIVADWRYAIPADPTKPADPTTNPTHPVLYVGGEGGVFRSLDAGVTWALYPNSAFDGSVRDGGLLPNAHVTGLTTALGNVDPTTGRAVAQPGDPNTLLATTFGRGQFAIRLAPIVFPSSIQLDPNLPAPNGSTNGSTAADGTPLVTTAQPVIDGFSEQSAFGNVVRITLYDLTDPSNPRVIGGFDPSKPSTANVGNQTDSSGHFAVQVRLGSFPSNGLKVIGIQATDASGTVGNMATLKITLQATNLGLPQPPTAPTLALLPSDDTSGGQDVTRVTTPHLIGRSDPSTASNPVTITLVQLGGPPITVPAPVITSSADGTFSFQLPPLADGTYTFQVKASNVYSPPSTTGQSLTFTVKTVGPSTAPTLQINPADDSGIKGDGITDVRQPRFIGQTDPGAIVDLYSLYSVLTSTITVPATSVTGNVQGLKINLSQLNIANPQALSITLTGPDGTLVPVTGVGDAVIISGLNGKPAAGTYVLKIVNTTPNSGTLNGWSLILTDANRITNTFVSTQSGVSGSLSQPKLATTTADSSGRYSIQLPKVLVNGPIALEAIAHDVAGNAAPAASPVLNLSIQTVAGDYNLDGKTDPAVVQRVNPSQLQWSIQNVSAPGGFAFGAGGLDVPLSGDFDGDGKTDVALYRPSTATWYINRSSLGQQTVASFGWPGVDIPVPADYTGSGMTDIALYRPTNGQWYIIGPDNNLVLLRDSSGNLILDANGKPQVPFFGGPGDLPVPGNYNGLGKDQLAVYDPTTSTFFTLGTDGIGRPLVLGKAGDVPVPGQYDNTVTYHQTEYAVFDPTTAIWTIIGPSGIRNVQFGAPGDIPAPGDYDGTGVTELAVYRPSNGLLYVMGASGTVQLNVKNGVPANAPETYRQAASVPADYSASGSADLTLFQRTTPGLGQWFIQNVTSASGVNFGAGALDVPLVGDFTGSGFSQLALYRPSTGQWFVPSLGGSGTVSFGEPGVDIPVPGRYLGGNTSYLGVFRPTTGQWFYAGQTVQFGTAGDLPVPGNYNGTGLTELSVYRPSTSQWLILSPNGTTQTINIGQPGDVPVPGNYSGTGRDQPAVYRPSTGQFIIENPDFLGQTTITLGSPSSIPAPGNYDGNGRDEPAVYNPATAVWSILKPDGTVRTVSYGTPGAAAIPALAPYIYRGAGAGLQAQAFQSTTAATTSSTRSPLIAADLHVAQANPASGSGSGAGSSSGGGSGTPPSPTAVTSSGNGRQRVVAQATRHPAPHSLHDAALAQLERLAGRHAKVRYPGH